MSRTQLSLNDFLSGSKKFARKQKRSLSRNDSERSLDRMKISAFKKNDYQNAEQLSHKKNKFVNQEEETYYEQRDHRFPIKKVRSIESSQELYSARNKKQDWRVESEESEQQERYYNSKRNNVDSLGDSFQSFKGKAKQFVESLARKINIQIGSINNTINEFNRSLKKTIDIQYSKLRTAIKNAVEDIFENQEDNIKKLAKMEERAINQQLSDVRSELEAMYGKLQKYKQDLDGPNWKKITGEILSSDIQSNVIDLIKKSQKTKILRSIKIALDQKKEEAFAVSLQELLQVNFIGGSEYNHQSFGLQVS